MSEHPEEEKARELWHRIRALTGWRDEKIDLWFTLRNPLLGDTSAEWMMLNGKAARLEKFIKEAEDAKEAYKHGQ